MFTAAGDASVAERDKVCVCVCVRACVCVCVRGFLTHPVLPPSVLGTGINECTDGHSLISSNRQAVKEATWGHPPTCTPSSVLGRVQIRAQTTGDADFVWRLARSPLNSRETISESRMGCLARYCEGAERRRCVTGERLGAVKLHVG